MIQRYSSAGPNKQMFEMYNMTVKQPENAYGKISQSPPDIEE